MAKKIFNEKKYQKNRKKLNTIGIVWVVCVLFIGTVLIISGVISVNKRSKDTSGSVTGITGDLEIDIDADNIFDTTHEPVLRDVSGYDGPKTQAELDAAEEIIKNEHTVNSGEAGWFEDKNAEVDEIYNLRAGYNSYISDTKYNESAERMHGAQANSGITKVANSIIDKAVGMQKGMSPAFGNMENVAVKGFSAFGIIFGIIAMLVCCLPGLGLILIANSRSIYAFAAQSSIPVVKESTKQMAPAFGLVAKEVAKGYKTGIKDKGKKKKTVKKIK